MAIPLYKLTRERTRIAFVGPVDQAGKQAFADRGFECLEFTPETMPAKEDFWIVDSIIVTQAPAKPREVVRFLTDFARDLLAADCRIYLRCATRPDVLDGVAARKLVIEAIDRLQLPSVGMSDMERATLGNWDLERGQPARCPYVAVGADSEHWATLVERVVCNPTGPAPRGVQQVKVIDANGQEASVAQETSILLRRAFHDCSRLELFEIGQGKSGPQAYRAFVTPTQSHIGEPWPHQYFVKIGGRPIIAKEFINYRDTVLEHIPYHLGPRLREERCVLGSQYGIMVCDYVSNASSLGKCARTGLGAAAINNLFANTISAWRHGDTDEAIDFGDLVRKYFPVNPPPSFRQSKIDDLGHKNPHQALADKLSRYRSKPALLGTIHGDMHAKNVMVRGSDAILIDFEKLALNGPVLMDVASLEAGLLDDVFWGDDRPPQDVLAFLRPLYRAEAFSRSRLKQQPTEKTHWFYDDVRCIRMHAKTYEREKRQYPWMLAAIMLKKACKAQDQDQLVKKWGEDRLGLEPEWVRAIMYILASDLLESLTDS